MFNRVGAGLGWDAALCLFCVVGFCFSEPDILDINDPNSLREWVDKRRKEKAEKKEEPPRIDIVAEVRGLSKDRQESQYLDLIKHVDDSYLSENRAGTSVLGLGLVLAGELGCKDDYATHMESWFRHYSSLDFDLVDLLYQGFSVEKWHALFNEQYATNTNSRSRFKMRAYAFRESLVLDDPNVAVATNSMNDLEILLSLEESGGKLGLRTVIKNMSEHDIFVMPYSRVMRVDWIRKDGVLLPVLHNKELHPMLAPRDPLFLYPDDELVRERPLRPVCTVENIEIPYSAYFTWPERPPTTRRCVRFGGVWIAMDDEDAVVCARAVVDPFTEEEVAVLARSLEHRRGRGVRYRIVEESLYSKPILFVSKKGVVSRLEDGNE